MHAAWIWSATACLAERDGENEGEMSMLGMVYVDGSMLASLAARRESRYAVERASWRVVMSLWEDAVIVSVAIAEEFGSKVRRLYRKRNIRRSRVEVMIASRTDRI